MTLVQHLRTSDEERDKLRDNAQSMHRLLKERGIPFISDRSHIVSVLVGDDRVCKRASDILLERHGIYVQSINAPSVRVGEEILRIAPGVVHSVGEVRDPVRSPRVRGWELLTEECLRGRVRSIV